MTSADTDFDKRRKLNDVTETRIQDDEPEFEFLRVDNSPYDVSYVCLLIPRFGNHLLFGDITSYLEIWMQKICISHAWKLTYLDIHPEYLHWVMSVQMTDTPSRMIKLVREYTSSQIFEEFPKFKKDNQSNEFWAAPNLVLAGRQPHPEPLIKEFIRFTREGQGLSFGRG